MCGNMWGKNYNFVKHLVNNLNEYACSNKQCNGIFGGTLFFLTKEMFNLNVIRPMIYIENDSICGYIACFQAHISVGLLQGYMVPLTGYKICAKDIISLIYLKQFQE